LNTTNSGGARKTAASTKEFYMSLPTFTLSNGQTIKLGKSPARHDARTLQLSKYLSTATLGPPPASQDYTKKVSKWPTMLNNEIGDCTIACAGHMIEQWTTYANSSPTIPTDNTILKTYEAVSGYNPANPNTDRGAVILDVLNYWRNTGIGGDNILAFTSLEPQNHTEIMDAVTLFGNAYIGVQLPISAQNQQVWAVPAGGATGLGEAGSWGGHAVPIVAYDQRGVTVVTWGALKRVTWGFLNAYSDEAYAVLSRDWINNVTKVAPSQLDLNALNKDLQQITQVAAAAASSGGSSAGGSSAGSGGNRR
jgi:hypothetical protein